MFKLPEKKKSEGHSFKETAPDSWVQSARKNVSREKCRTAKGQGKIPAKKLYAGTKHRKGV